VRIRIALAAATAVTFMITSFDIGPVAAQTPAGAHTIQQQGNAEVWPYVLTRLTSGAGGARQAPDLSVDYLLWPKLVGISLSIPAPPEKSRSATVHTPAARGAPAAAVAAVPAPPPPPPPTDATSTDTTDWQCIRVHESGDEYNDPSMPSGAYGILETTWVSNGYSGWPYQATPLTQDALALKLYGEYGWTPWSTRFACGLA
jgi:hypothetical protein